MRRKQSYRFPFAKYPAVRFALLFAAGIVLAHQLSINIYLWIGLFLTTVSAWGWAEIRSRKTMQAGFTNGAIACYLAGIICFGGFWQTIFDNGQTPPSAKLLSAYTWETIEAKGTVQNIGQSSSGKYQLDVTVDSTVISDSLRWLEPYNLRAIFDPAETSLPDTIALGATLIFEATIYPLDDISNPYEFDYKGYLASQDIYMQAGIDSIYSIIQNHSRLSWSWWRRHAIKLIDTNFSAENAPVAKALLIGYKNELQRDEKLAFSRVGLSHIMAVSGLHVGFIIAPFWIIIPFFWSFRRGKQIGLGLLVVILIMYAGITGFSASVTRASITGGLLAYGRLFHKSRDSKNLTAVAAIIILLLDPSEIFSIGFQLSFAAVYIILLVLPVVQAIIPKKIRHHWYGKPVMIVIVSLIVQLGLYPFLSYYFGEFSLVGPIANALIVPWLGLLVPYAIGLLFVSIYWPAIGFILNAPCRWFLDFLQWFVTTAASWHWSWIQTPVTGFFIFLIWLAALGFMASLPYAKRRWKMLILFLAIYCAQQTSRLYRALQPPTLKVSMLDVGQGDAAYIQTPGDQHILIDAGRWTPTYNSARYIIIPHLKALGVQKLDAVFLSHPHADHIGGMKELIKTMEIGTIYNSGMAYDSQLYQDYLKLAEEHGIEVQALSAGQAINLDPSMRFLIYGPSTANHYSDPNEHSLVIELIYGKTQFLFMGDAGAAQEQLVMQNYGDMLNTDFLKVGHHGSRTSSSSSFLKIATPNLSAVSLDFNNKFRHPHPKAVQRLSNAQTKLLYTSLDGALLFESNGDSITQIEWR